MLLHPDHRILVAQSREHRTGTSPFLSRSTALRFTPDAGPRVRSGFGDSAIGKLPMPPEQIRALRTHRPPTTTDTRRGPGGARRGNSGARTGTASGRTGRTAGRRLGVPGRGARAGMRRAGPGARRGSGRVRGGQAGARLVPRYTAFAIAAAISLFLAVSEHSVARVWAFLDYAAGVLSLLSLTATALWGLAATDRIVLGPGHRLVAQAVHRGTAVAGLGFLALHIWVKVAAGSTSATAAAVPFTAAAQPVLVGLGTLAGYLFLAVAVTGAVRGVFARGNGSGTRWWRALHMGAYVAWGMSLLHGLRAGRPVADWVVAGYALCLTGVAVVLIMRLAPRRNAPKSGTRSKEQP